MEPRLFVAGARARGGGAYRFEAETDVIHEHGHFAVLVKACGKAERIGEVDAHHVRFEHRIGVVEHFAAQPHERRDVFGDFAEFDHLIMRHVGLVVEDEIRFDDVLVSEGEKIGGGLVHRVVPKILRNISHGSLFSHRWGGFFNLGQDKYG